MKPAPSESQIETKLKNLPPDISLRLEKRLIFAPWTARGVKRSQTLNLIYLTLIMLIAFIGLTPQGRAFAQTIFEFFTTTDRSSFPLSKEELDLMYAPVSPRALSLIEVTPLPPISGNCLKPEDVGTYKCEVQRVEKELNFDIKEFSTIPLGHTFSEISFYPGNSSTNIVVWIAYLPSISLVQGIGDFPPASDWDKVPSSAVQQVRIGEYDGEYVNGHFLLGNGDTKLTWSATGAEQRIRWREGERWFELTTYKITSKHGI